MKIILINGAPCSGKSTFCDLAKQQCRGVSEYSTVDCIKDIASSIGWNGKKTPKDRKFLSDLKDLLTEYNDFPVKDCENYIKHYTQILPQKGLDNVEPVIFIHCREPQEIEKLKQRWNARTLVIRRTKAEDAGTSNHADAEVLNYDYDYSIDNNGSIMGLNRKVSEFMEYIYQEDFESKIGEEECTE